ncbi:MAG TPA: ATP-dependent DNA helicase [Candidatus Angelobacter sp.]|nr:ATP-dependent DNA helicase [Candidatus Angelobacter sp.]
MSVAAVPSLPDFGPGDLVELLGIPFSAEQLDAVTAPMQPYVVVAGAGSGKTTVMTARVVWLVATGQVRPEEVLGLTFTNKAAGELSGRVRRAVQQLSDRTAGVPHDEVGEPTVSTYHAFAGRLLAEHGLRIGVEPGSRLLTEAASVQLAHRVVTRTSRDLSTLGRTVASVVEHVRALDAELAEHCLGTDDLRTWDLALLREIGDLDAPQKDTQTLRDVCRARVELAHLVEEFRAARGVRDLVDFSDQMRLGAQLARECPEVGAALREQFRVVLLDEYQDTSVAQRLMLTGLFGGGHPVTAVGDPLQAIYGFRGASVANIDGFPRHFPRADGRPAPVLRLAENRRSGIRILEAANGLAAPLRAHHPQVAPLLPPASGAKAPGGLRVALHASYAEEVAWVAERVAEVVDAGVPPGDVAILCRARSDFPALLGALGERDVPVDVVGLDGLLAMPEVAEVVAVLEVLHDSTANPSLVRLLAGPRWRIGLRDLALLGERAVALAGAEGRARGDVDTRLDAAVAGVDPAEVVSLLDALDDPGPLGYDPRARERFAALSAEIRQLRRSLGDPLPDLVHRVVTVTGLDVEMASSPEVLRLHRAEGLASFVELVAGFADAEGDAGVGAFLSWLSMAARFGKVPELERPVRSDAVQLMTVHRSKGLEWPVVVLPSLTATVFPSERGMTRWTTNAKAVPYPLRGDGAALPTLGGFRAKDHREFASACVEHSLLDELRLAYVAVTRAERLVLASSSWWGPTQKERRGPSPYLLDLRDQCLSGGGTVDCWAAEPPEGETSPTYGRSVDVVWPPAPDSELRSRLVAAAAAVRGDVGRTVDDLRAEHTALTRGSASPLLGLDAADVELVQGWDDDIALLLEERRAERSAGRVVPLPASLPASDLVRLAADPEAFTRRLVRPLPTAPAPAARRGTRFHAWVEAHYGVTPLLDPDDLPGAADPDIDTDDELAAMQAAFLASPYADRSPLGVEVPFSLVLGGRVVPGRIDAVFASTGPDGTTRYEVVDWKTTRAEDSDPLQLAVYRVAYAELAGVPLDRVDAAFLYVRTGTVARPDALPDRAALEALLVG